VQLVMMGLFITLAIVAAFRFRIEPAGNSVRTA
jgi:hypothetical protein